MPLFPRSGSSIRLSSGEGRYLQQVPTNNGADPHEACHQEPLVKDSHDLWVISKADEGTVLLSPILFPELNLTAVKSKIVLEKGKGSSAQWRPEYVSDQQWTFFSVAWGTRLQHLHGICKFTGHTKVGHTASHSVNDNDKWTLTPVVTCEDGAELWDEQAQLRAVSPGIRDVRLTDKWETLYRCCWGTSLKPAPFTMKIVGQRAAVGKSSLICHLAEEEVSEVLHSSAGSIRPKDCSIDCNGLAWKVVDIPGCNGLHMAKGWTGREKRGPVTVKEFIKHYKLEDPTDTDLLLYVTSLCAASKRGAADQRLEQELVHKLYNNVACIPLAIVNTHATRPLTPHCRLETMRHLGLSHVFNVNVPWETHVRMPPHTIAEQRASHDFPGLLTALSPQSLDNSWCAYSQIQVAHLARTQVHEELASLSRPGFLELAWVLSSHTVLGLVAPIYGPVLESVSRMLSMALVMFDAVGMVSRPGSAERVRAKADSCISQLEKDEPLLKQKNAQFKAAEEAAAKEQRRRRGAGQHVAEAAAETGLVAVMEVEIKEALKPATDEAKAALGEEVFSSLMAELASEVATMALDAALPFVGAVITAACTPHAYRKLGQFVSIVACQHHEDWLLAHWHELTGTPAPTSGFPTKPSLPPTDRAAAAEHKDQWLADSVQSLALDSPVYCPMPAGSGPCSGPASAAVRVGLRDSASSFPASDPAQGRDAWARAPYPSWLESVDSSSASSRWLGSSAHSLLPGDSVTSRELDSLI